MSAMGYLVDGAGIVLPVQRIETREEKFFVVGHGKTDDDYPAHPLGPLRWYAADDSLICIANVDIDVDALRYGDSLTVGMPVDMNETTAAGGVWRRVRAGAL